MKKFLYLLTTVVGLSLPSLLHAQTPGTLKWRYSTGGGSSSPAIGPDGTIYVGSDDHKVYAINPNGTLKWSYTTGDKISASPSISRDGTAIYIGSYDGKLYALNSSSGSLNWTYQTDLLFGTTPQAIYSSCAVASDGETVYFGGGDFWMYAINTDDGTLKWRNFGNAAVVSLAPAIGKDGTVYMNESGVTLHAFNPNGTSKWSFNCFSQLSAPAIGSDGTICIGANNPPGYGGGLFIINPDGTQRYFTDTLDPIQSTPVIGPNGTIFVGHQGGGISAFTSTGTQLWFSGTDGYLFGAAAVTSDQTIYVGTSAGKLQAFSTSNGASKWTYATPSGSAIYSSSVIGRDGTIYFESTDGYLYAVYGSAGPAFSAWPMMQKTLDHDADASGTSYDHMLDINFGGVEFDKVGPAVTGVTSSDYWNAFSTPFSSFGAVANLKWSDASSSGVGMTVANAPGKWDNGVTSDGMYVTYIYNNSLTNILVTLTNLPSGTYDFYLYGHGPVDAANSIFDLTVGSTSYGSEATTTGSGWNTAVWNEGDQYVVYRNIDVVRGQDVLISVSPDSLNFAIANGIQVVRKP